MKRTSWTRITWTVLATSPWLMSTLALASSEGGAHHGPPHSVPLNVWFHFFNLGVLIFVLYRALRGPLRNYLVKRQDTIRAALERSEAARLDAEQRARTYETRLAGLAAEIAALRQETESAARAEASHLIENAKASAARVESDTQRILKDELTRARYQLRREAIDLAVQMAEGLLAGRMNEADQRRLAEEYLQRVGQSTEVH